MLDQSHLNDNIKVYPHDAILARSILRLFPYFVKPNHLTVLRYAMVPLVLFFVIDGNYPVGLLLFLFAAFTDTLDGSLARTRRQITLWGVIHDPVSDKLLITSILAVLVIKHINPLLSTIIIGMEAVFIIGGIIFKSHGSLQMANWWGKSKMIFQVIGVMLILIWLIVGFPLLKSAAEWSLITAIVLSSIGVLKYGARFGS